MVIFNFLFPRTCLSCGKNGGYVCGKCVSKVRKIEQVCAYCNKATIDGLTHIKCRKKPELDGLVSLWSYWGVIRKAILGLKYKFATDISKELTGHLAKYLKDNSYVFSRDWVLIPIPLHKSRKNWRGFNQVEEIGKQLSEKMEWKYNNSILARSKKRPPQTDLKGEERKVNVKDVFTINPNIKLTDQRINKSFLLFDDVYTTGSTLKEAAKVLKKSGAKKVWGLTIAR
jgi:ComF family protein